jgi:hypothetical protein
MNQRDPIDRWLELRRAALPSPGFTDGVIAALERSPDRRANRDRRRSHRVLPIAIGLAAAALVAHAALVALLLLIAPTLAL